MCVTQETEIKEYFCVIQETEKASVKTLDENLRTLRADLSNRQVKLQELENSFDQLTAQKLGKINK